MPSPRHPSEAQIEAVRTNLASGCSREAAARRAEITDSVLRVWLEDGLRARAIGRHPSTRKLLDVMERTEADVQVASGAQVRRAAAEDWRAAAWILEHQAKADSASARPPAADELPDGKKINLLDRVNRARRIAALRHETDAKGKPRPVSWPNVAKRIGISMDQCKRIYADYRSWDVEVSDPVEAVDRAIALRQVAIHRLGELAVSATNDSAQVGAIRAMIEVDRERIEMEQAAGRMPRNLNRYRAEAEFSTIVREMLDVMERRGVKSEVLDEIHGVVRGHMGERGNVRSISSARA